MNWLKLIVMFPIIGILELIRTVFILSSSIIFMVYFILRYGVDGADKKVEEKIEKARRNVHENK